MSTVDLKADFRRFMILCFKAMLDAMKARGKSKVSCDVILQFINPMYGLTEDNVKLIMDKMISTKYLRFRDYQGKRYFSPSKLGQERWDAHVNASLYEITEVADQYARGGA